MDSQLIEIIALCVCFAAGVVFCFFGNRWIKVILAIYGFAVGFVVAHALLTNLTTLGGLEVLLCSLGAGLVGALLFVLLLFLGIFFIGFGGGVLLCLLIIDIFSLNLFDWYVYISVLVIASILGSLTLNLRRIFLSIFTSFIGSALISLGIYQVTSGKPIEVLVFFRDRQAIHEVYSSIVFLACLAGLFVIGLVVQLAVTSKRKGKIRT